MPFCFYWATLYLRNVIEILPNAETTSCISLFKVMAAAKGRLECLVHHIAEKRTYRVETKHLSSSDGNADIDHSKDLEELSLGPRLQINPKSGLNDELLDIRVHGLLPGQKVSLRAHVLSECGEYRFESRAEYVADDDGKVMGMSSQVYYVVM